MTEITIRPRVGVRELKAHFSRYLDHVRDGGTVIVTDRGQSVAELIPLGRRDRLAELIASGAVRPARRAKGTLPTAIAGSGPVSDLVSDQRR